MPFEIIPTIIPNKNNPYIAPVKSLHDPKITPDPQGTTVKGVEPLYEART